MCRALDSLTTPSLLLHKPRRDDAYIQRMLMCLKRLQVDHVLPATRPDPATCYQGLPEHREMLDQTVAIARSAELVAEAAGVPIAPGGDSNAFWEGRYPR
jgi:hypothetical protein